MTAPHATSRLAPLSAVAAAALLAGCNGNGPIRRLFVDRPAEPAPPVAAPETDTVSSDASQTLQASLEASPEQTAETTQDWAISSQTAAPSTSVRSAAPPNDARFSLFGEVNGLGGASSQFGATENIARVSFATEGADFDPDINAAGTRMVFASTQHARNADIYIKRIDGTTVTQLTSDPGNDVMPQFSPDDAHIAFASDRGGNWDVYVMDRNGGPAIRITNDPAQELHPSWSPDGSMLVFCRLGDQSGRWELWVAEVANPAQKKFIGYGLFPQWCPKPGSNKIVYQKARERGSRLFGIWTLDFIEGEGVNPTEIVSAANAAAINPSWSPDGSMIAFATVTEPDSLGRSTQSASDIWLIDVNGQNRVNLTHGEFANLQPAWGENGWIYFVSNRTGMDNIWGVDTRRPMNLANATGAASTDTDVAGVPTDE